MCSGRNSKDNYMIDVIVVCVIRTYVYALTKLVSH